MQIKTGRRDFVRTLGISAAALPLFRAAHAAADGHGFPQRLLVVFVPDGTVHDEWAPSGGRTDFSLDSRILAPLAPYQSNLIILDGMDQKTTEQGPGDGHQKGMGHMLTGAPLLPGNANGASLGGGISLDQHIANAIGGETRFRSLELGVHSGNYDSAWSRMSYRDADQPNPPQQDPYAAFERIFGGLGEDPTGAKRRRNLRQSVVDFIQQDFKRLQGRLGRDARERLQSHMEGIREIERRLGSSASLGEACAPPEMGSPLDLGKDANYPALTRLQQDILTMAFACDLTRVGSMQYTRSVGKITLPWLGIDEEHHEVSHSRQIEKRTRIYRWYAEEVARFLGKLSSVPEGDGTMLDNTVVLWCSDLGDGRTHDLNRVPWIVAGSGGGVLETGQYLQLGGRSHCDVLLTLARAFGLDDETFGLKEYNTGPVTEMLA